MIWDFERTIISDAIPLLEWLPENRKYRRDLNIAGDKLKAFYKERIEEARQRVKTDHDPRDFVALYIKEVEKIPIPKATKIQEDWTIQVMSDFFIAGSETTATTLKWAMLLMALNPEVIILHTVHLSHS